MAPRPARTAARCPGGGARSAARPRGRRAGRRSASGSGGRSPRPVRYSAWGQEPLSAQPRPRRLAPRLRGSPGRGGARTGCATSRGGVPGARQKRQDSLGWGVTFAPWKVRTVGSRGEMSLARFEGGVAGGHPTSSAVDSSARGPASPFHQATLARE